MIPFLELCEKIQGEIATGQCDTVLPPIRCLSERYQVGDSTVKRALNRLKEMDYLEGLQGKCVKVNPKALNNIFFRQNIVIYIHLKMLGFPFYLRALEHLRNQLEDVFALVHIVNSATQLQECGFVPDALILTEVSDPAELAEIAGICPTERIIKLNLADPDYQCVGTDNERAGEMALNYLHNVCGHRHVGIISHELKYSYGVNRLRCDGARRFAADHPQLVLHVTEAAAAEQAHEVTARLLTENPEITAIFVTMDFLALGVYSYCREARLIIPEDISVLGFDDRDFASMLYPSLTTYQEDAETIGRLLFGQLSHIIRHHYNPSAILVEPILVARNSVIKK